MENISDPLCAPSWHQPFLDDVASTDTVIVLETAAGARVVLVSEHEYLRLARGKVVQPDAVDKLSGREKKILNLVSLGHSGAQIAQELSLAPNTVAQHLVSVRRKFGVTTTAAAVDVGRRIRLV